MYHLVGHLGTVKNIFENFNNEITETLGIVFLAKEKYFKSKDNYFQLILSNFWLQSSILFLILAIVKPNDFLKEKIMPINKHRLRRIDKNVLNTISFC